MSNFISTLSRSVAYAPNFVYRSIFVASLVDQELTFYINQLRSLASEFSNFDEDFCDVWPSGWSLCPVQSKLLRNFSFEFCVCWFPTQLCHHFHWIKIAHCIIHTPSRSVFHTCLLFSPCALTVFYFSSVIDSGLSCEIVWLKSISAHSGLVLITDRSILSCCLNAFCCLNFRFSWLSVLSILSVLLSSIWTELQICISLPTVPLLSRHILVHTLISLTGIWLTVWNVSVTIDVSERCCLNG